MKIIHVVGLDKFSMVGFRIFESVFPGCNNAVLFANQKVEEDTSGISVYKRYNIFFPFLLRRIFDADIVIFHGMNDEKLRMLKSIPKEVKTIWLGWGYDYYNLLNINLLKEKTVNAVSSRKKLSFYLRLKSYIKSRFIGVNDRMELINKIDVFSPVLHEDYVLIKKSLHEFLPRYATWNYGTLEDDLIRGYEGRWVNGDNILLGNSAARTNNHLDAIELIKNLDLASRKVISPLSYGDSENRMLVIKAGVHELGDAFQPLVEFLPIDDYLEIIQSCSVVIMNHLRQQALGNIIIALYMGAKIFLDKANPVYEFFKKQGAYVFSLEELQMESNERLSKDKVEINRSILRKHWSREVIYSKTRYIINMVMESR